jgi:6-phosphogluconolactonase
MATEVLIARDGDSFIKKAADVFLESCAQAVKERKTFSVAMAGGSTPKKLYALLAEPYYQQRVSWDKTHVFWGDERCVSPDHADSNFKMTWDALLSKVPLPEKNIFRMPGEMIPAVDGAKAYEQAMKVFFRWDRPWPKFDLILLGLGEDGHTASLFPGTTALNQGTHWVVANHVDKLSADRLTLTFPVLNNARRVLFLCAGISKAPVIKDIFREDSPRDRYPAQRVNPTAGELIWLLDKEACSQMPPDAKYKAFHL